MTSLMVGLYGIFLVLVGARGNAGVFADELRQDGRDFLPWLAAIIVLAVLAEGESTRKLVMPIVVLLALNFFLRNWDTVRSEFSKLGVPLP